MLSILKGVVSLVLYVFCLVIHAVVILVSAIFVYLLPVKKWRAFLQRRYFQKFAISFARCNALIMSISTRDQWDIAGTGPLKKDGWYLLISNHQSWIDILVLGKVFVGKLPPLKFFMKKELLWQLPFAGIACYVLGYPFMSRHTHVQIKKNPQLKGKDIETTKNACRRMRELPTVLINFSEGTRFTKKKKESQQSPFQYLLKPRAGGVAVVLHELNENITGILNVVITYTPKVPSFWDFACGRFGKIIVRYEVLPVTPDLIGDYDNDRNFRPHLQQWFNTLWERNDQLIAQLHQQNR